MKSHFLRSWRLVVYVIHVIHEEPFFASIHMSINDTFEMRPEEHTSCGNWREREETSLCPVKFPRGLVKLTLHGLEIAVWS